ncbi:hypothetical protein ETB97_006310 [Aspergillus alliaceus]|uniref:tyrosinase n=1 Tax=Petromyces alliaceus TaxID=209559 RepID=A0A8H5ZVG9_PETAA|nr:hypothetical protein ETB97_006310 [Aspergillus burnettii]
MPDRSIKTRGTRIRKDIEELTRQELDKLVRAFYMLQAADPGMLPNLNEDSFYVIAGYHGQPFRGAGYGNMNWWGGYCHHGNVLFPTWHRAYLLRLEEALNNVSGSTDVALPYWNQFKKTGVPKIFTDKEYTFSTKVAPSDFNSNDIHITEGGAFTIRNPLYSYKMQQRIYDNLKRVAVSADGQKTKAIDYSKYKDYETVRCPYSGLVGPGDLDETRIYNESVKKPIEDLQKNVTEWLGNKSTTLVPGMSDLYVRAAFEAPNYTVFSNTTSAAKWNDDQYGRQATWNPNFAVSVEEPHNGMHLAVGGYSFPDVNNTRPYFPKSNGDMGENDTASFDPIFYFHHSFVDYIFALWQDLHQAEGVKIIENYPGTSPIDSQGPTPFTAADSHLNMKTPLIPFKRNKTDYLTSEDVVDIKACGYNYQPPKIPPAAPGPVGSPSTVQVAKDTNQSALPIVRVSGISRAQRPGSFVIRVLASTGKREEVVGIVPVFSRWHVPSCTNCSNTLEVTAHKVLHPDLLVNNNERLIQHSPEKRLECAKSLKLRLEVLENPRADLPYKDMPKEGLPKTEGQVLTPLHKDSILDPDPTVEVLPCMVTSPIR